MTIKPILSWANLVWNLFPFLYPPGWPVAWQNIDWVSPLAESQDKGVFGEPIGMEKTRTRDRMFSLKPRHKASFCFWLVGGWMGCSRARWGVVVCLPATMLQGSQGRRKRLVEGRNKFANPNYSSGQPVCLSSLWIKLPSYLSKHISMCNLVPGS